MKKDLDTSLNARLLRYVQNKTNAPKKYDMIYDIICYDTIRTTRLKVTRTITVVMQSTGMAIRVAAWFNKDEGKNENALKRALAIF